MKLRDTKKPPEILFIRIALIVELGARGRHSIKYHW